MTSINSFTPPLTKDLSNTLSSSYASVKKLGGRIVHFVFDIPNQMQANRNIAIANYAVVNIVCLAVFEFVANRLDPSNAIGKERSYTNIVLNGAFAGSASFACNYAFSKLTHYELSRTALLLITLAGTAFRLLRIRGTSTPEETNKQTPNKKVATKQPGKNDAAATSSIQPKFSDHTPSQTTVLKKETTPPTNNAPVNQTAAKGVEAKKLVTDNNASQGSAQTKQETPSVNQTAKKVETAKDERAKSASGSQSTPAANVPSSVNKPTPKDESAAKSEDQPKADVADAGKKGGNVAEAKAAATDQKHKGSTEADAANVDEDAGKPNADVADASKKDASTTAADDAKKDNKGVGALTKSTDWKSITVENALEDAIKDISTEKRLTNAQLRAAYTAPTQKQKRNNTPKAQVFNAKENLDGQKKRIEDAIRAHNLENLAAAKTAYGTAYEKYTEALVVYKTVSGSKDS